MHVRNAAKCLRDANTEAQLVARILTHAKPLVGADDDVNRAQTALVPPVGCVGAVVIHVLWTHACVHVYVPARIAIYVYLSREGRRTNH